MTQNELFEKVTDMAQKFDELTEAEKLGVELQVAGIKYYKAKMEEENGKKADSETGRRTASSLDSGR